MKLITLILSFAIGCTTTSCAQKPDTTTTPPPTTEYIVGADISLLPTYMAAHAVFKSEDGTTVDPLQHLKKQGVTMARVRLFVNPDPNSTACQDLDYVTALCKQLKEIGYNIMLDLHYSDTWADPAKQFMPEKWKGQTLEQLQNTIYNYTAQTLNHLKNNSITPISIQIGNEITNGMMWDVAKVDLWGNAQFDTPTQWQALTSLLDGASQACTEAAPDAKIIIHTERAGDREATLRFYKIITEAGVKFDIIGLSYYPFWHGTLDMLDATISALEYNQPEKEIQIVEVAYPYDPMGFPNDSQYPTTYPATPQGQAQFTEELISMLKKHTTVTGLLWWFPEETYSPNKRIHPDFYRGLYHCKTGFALPALEKLTTFSQR